MTYGRGRCSWALTRPSHQPLVFSPRLASVIMELSQTVLTLHRLSLMYEESSDQNGTLWFHRTMAHLDHALARCTRSIIRSFAG